MADTNNTAALATVRAFATWNRDDHMLALVEAARGGDATAAREVAHYVDNLKWAGEWSAIEAGNFAEVL